MIPNVVREIPGGEQWQTQIDYSRADNWLVVEDAGKEVDVIYFYPTSFTKLSPDEPDVCAIDNQTMRAAAPEAYATQATAFSTCANIYAPYYRQINAEYALTLTADQTAELLRYAASQDCARALDYYFEHHNNGKPFILAGHSQGAQTLTWLLADYMKEHPQHYKNMVCAYVLGYSVTEQYLQQFDHLKFAQGVDDTGVIISWNAEGPGNASQHNAVVTEGAISINPLNWKRDDTYAPASENLGSLNSEGVLVEGYADAQVEPVRGVVVCTTADPAVYALQHPADALFGTESYHAYDYGFYYANLRENAAVRIAAFAQNNTK